MYPGIDPSVRYEFRDDRPSDPYRRRRTVLGWFGCVLAFAGLLLALVGVSLFFYWLYGAKPDPLVKMPAIVDGEIQTPPMVLDTTLRYHVSLRFKLSMPVDQAQLIERTSDGEQLQQLPHRFAIKYRLIDKEGRLIQSEDVTVSNDSKEKKTGDINVVMDETGKRYDMQIVSKLDGFRIDAADDIRIVLSIDQLDLESGHHHAEVENAEFLFYAQLADFEEYITELLVLMVIISGLGLFFFAAGLLMIVLGLVTSAERWKRLIRETQEQILVKQNMYR